MTRIRATWSSFFGSRNSRFESQFRTWPLPLLCIFILYWVFSWIKKPAQARDLPDSDSSWWQSSKDVSDPFAKVVNPVQSCTYKIIHLGFNEVLWTERIQNILSKVQSMTLQHVRNSPPRSSWCQWVCGLQKPASCQTRSFRSGLVWACRVPRF